jgi:hypothetical protein
MKTPTKPKTKKTTYKCNEFSTEIQEIGAILDSHLEVINDHADLIDNHGEVINSYADSWQHIREDQEILSHRINLVFWFCGITTAIATSLAITALVCK